MESKGRNWIKEKGKKTGRIKGTLEGMEGQEWERKEGWWKGRHRKRETVGMEEETIEKGGRER